MKRGPSERAQVLSHRSRSCTREKIIGQYMELGWGGQSLLFLPYSRRPKELAEKERERCPERQKVKTTKGNHQTDLNRGIG